MPAWRERRDYPFVFAAFADDVGSAAAAALGAMFQPAAPLSEALSERFDRSGAHAAVADVLAMALAHDGAWLDAATSTHVADAFLACFSTDAEFLTNGDLWRRDVTARSWTPLTSATFDTGVVGVEAGCAGILWIADED